MLMYSFENRDSRKSSGLLVTSMFSVVGETMHAAQAHKKALEKQSIEAVTENVLSPYVELKECLREQVPQLKLRNAGLIPRENESRI